VFTIVRRFFPDLSLLKVAEKLPKVSVSGAKSGNAVAVAAFFFTFFDELAFNIGLFCSLTTDKTLIDVFPSCFETELVRKVSYFPSFSEQFFRVFFSALSTQLHYCAVTGESKKKISRVGQRKKSRVAEPRVIFGVPTSENNF
jgi:hypothetical protein